MPRQHLAQFRRDTAAQWASVNPVLASGEPGHELDTGRLKLGDGSTAWNGLPYTTDAAILELPELVDAVSSVVREPAPGLLTVEHRVLPLSVALHSNTTAEVSLTPELTVIPAGAISLGQDMLTLSMAGTIVQNSGDPATLTIRIKRVVDPEGTPVAVTAWTLTVTDVPSESGVRPWSLSLPVNAVNIGVGPMCNGVANLRVATAGAVDFDLLSSVGAIVSVPTDDPWALEVTAQWSVAHANVEIVHSLGYIGHIRTEAI